VHNRVEDHIIIFDIKHITSKLTDIIFEKEWNCVVCTLSGLQNKLFIDKIGVSLFKPGINMEDIRFTNPRGIDRHAMHARYPWHEKFHFLCMLFSNLHRKTYRYIFYLMEEDGPKMYFIFLFFIFYSVVLFTTVLILVYPSISNVCNLISFCLHLRPE